MSGISIIIPVRNEEENVIPLSLEINDAFSANRFKWECIWVDDGSRDNTVEKLKEVCLDSRHRFFSHICNYGQSAAFITGIKEACFDIIATIDGDGQNDPCDIPVLLDLLLKSELDMVCGWRKKRCDGFCKTVSSRIANYYRNMLLKDGIHDSGCSLKVFKKECVQGIPHLKSMHRFLPVLISIAGYNKITEKPVAHRPRNSGKSNYGVHNRLWIGMLDTLAVLWMKKRAVYPTIKK